MLLTRKLYTSRAFDTFMSLFISRPKCSVIKVWQRPKKSSEKNAGAFCASFIIADVQIAASIGFTQSEQPVVLRQLIEYTPGLGGHALTNKP